MAAPAPQVVTFSYASSSPVGMVLWTYPLLALGDQLVAMACIPGRYVVAHVVVAAFGVYGFVWLLRLHRSMLALPHAVDAATIRLYRGSLGAAVVSRSDIVSATPIDAEAIARLPEKPSRLDLGGDRVLLTLRNPAMVRGPVRRVAARAVVVSVDDPGALCAAVGGAGARVTSPE